MTYKTRINLIASALYMNALLDFYTLNIFCLYLEYLGFLNKVNRFLFCQKQLHYIIFLCEDRFERLNSPPDLSTSLCLYLLDSVLCLLLLLWHRCIISYEALGLTLVWEVGIDGFEYSAVIKSCAQKIG